MTPPFDLRHHPAVMSPTLLIRSSARWLIGNPAVGWTILAVISVAAAFGMTRVRYNDDMRNAFPSEDQFGSLRATNEAFLCIVGGKRLLDGEVIGRLIEFDLELRRIPGIESVASLFEEMDSVRSIPFGMHPVSPSSRVSGGTHPDIGVDGKGMQEFFLSKDRETMLFVAEPEAGIRMVEDLAPIQREIEKLLSDLTRRTGLTADVTGIPALRVKVVKATRQEQRVFAIGCCFLGAAFAWLMFRRFVAVVLIFPVPILAYLWTVGGMGLAGEPVNSLNNMATVLIPIISLTDGIHLTYAIRRYLIEGRDPRSAAAAGLAEVGVPCFMTCFTTAVSFAVLLFSRNEIVARFGAVCACATAVVFVSVILLTPLLAASGLGRHLPPRHLRDGTMVFLPHLARIVTLYPRIIVAGAVVLTVVAIQAYFRLEYDFRYRENLDPSSKEWHAIERLEAAFGGSQPLVVLVSWPKSGVRDETKIEEALRRTQEVVAIPELTGSPFSVLTLLNLARNQNPKMRLDELHTVFPPRSLETILDLEQGAALVKTLLKDQGARRLAPRLEELGGHLRRIEEDLPGIRVRLVGLTSASIRESLPMIGQLTTTLFSAGFVIFLSIGFSLRSWRLGLASIIPNILPLVLTGTWIYLNGMDVLFVSALSFSICLGIAVDDTIHFLFHYRRNRMRGSEAGVAVRETLVSLGSSLVTSTGILVAGLSLLWTSELPTVRLFATVGMITLALAMLGDLIVLPAILVLVDRIGERTDQGRSAMEG